MLGFTSTYIELFLLLHEKCVIRKDISADMDNMYTCKNELKIFYFVFL